MKRKRRYRRVFRRYRIPYHAYYQIVDESNNGLRSGMAEEIDFKRTCNLLEPKLLPSLLIKFTIPINFHRISKQDKKKCGKKRDSSMFYNNANNRIVISIGPMNDQFEQLKFLPKDIFAISLLVIHASIFGVSSLRRRLTAVSPSINSIHREPRRDQFPVHTPSQARNESATRALSPRRPSISVARLPDTR